ncbi:MAG: serine/threonine-protein kinase [Microbacteriaceae bacterium]
MESSTSGPGSVLLRERYRPTDLIARGGMGSVFRARDELLDRDVAVKIFQAVNNVQVEVGKQELKVLASLSHHALVTLLDAGVDYSTPDEPHIFLVMELVSGTDLRHRLQAGPLNARQAAYIGYDLAEGLEYIHNRDLVHRDVKPANVLLVEYGADEIRPRAKLTDFGIAVVTDQQAAVAAGSTVGTAAYLSPEQARGLPVGPASDIYSLGLVLLEALTGTIAFPGEQLETIAARLAADPSVPDALPIGWGDLLRSMTAQNPDARPPARDVVVSLRQLVVDELGKHRGVPRSSDADDGELVASAPSDDTVDRVAALAARLLSAPIAIVSFGGRDRVWFRCKNDLDPHIFDARALSNPRVASEFGIGFHVTTPLCAGDGADLGTLCVLDFEPRELSDDDRAALADLAAVLVNGRELRNAVDNRTTANV